MKLLLLSNSTIVGHPYLEWPQDLIKRILGDETEALFIPYAAVTFSYDEYEAMVNKSLGAIGVKVRSIHHEENKLEAIQNAKAIFVGGGNTFQLLKMLYDNNLIDAIRRRVLKENIPYVGWSAGSNMACPSIKTTNDMPIAEPRSFAGLNLINFQINPHYTEQTIQGHGGESRLQRLQEYAAINDVPVVCLPEGCALSYDDNRWKLISSEPVKMIKKGGEITSFQNGYIDLP